MLTRGSRRIGSRGVLLLLKPTIKTAKGCAAQVVEKKLKKAVQGNGTILAIRREGLKQAAHRAVCPSKGAT